MTNETNETLSIPQFTTEDLTACQQIIELACERGAFKAIEMSTVGTVYDRLTSFLDIQKTLMTKNEEKDES